MRPATYLVRLSFEVEADSQADAERMATSHLLNITCLRRTGYHVAPLLPADPDAPPRVPLPPCDQF